MGKFVISGSSSGIGRVIVENLLGGGNEVVGLARNHQKFQPGSDSYIPIPIDFSEINSLEKKLKLIQKEHADIDAVIACCGFGRFAELEQFSVAQMRELLDVNFLSQAILTKVFLPNLKKRQGKVVFIGSESGLAGQKKGSMYCASKFALRGFAQSLRKECVSAGVGVTVINPGMVATPFFDHLDFQPGEDVMNAILPRQIADAVSFVIKAENNFVFEEINLQPMKKVIRKN